MRFGPRSLLLFGLASFVVACDGEVEQPASGTTAQDEPRDEADAPQLEEDLGEILATVGEVKVGSKEFELAAQRKAPANGESLSPEEKREILDRLITDKILYLEARKQRIDQDPKVQKVMVNTLLRQDVYSNVRNSDFSPEELQAYFDAHRDEFVVPEKVQIKRIFVRAGDRRSAGEAMRIAEDLRSQVAQNPERFKDIATESSEDPYRRRGGDLGFVSQEGKPGVPPEVIEQGFALDVEQVSAVFEAGGGYNVIYVANKRERVERTFEQMKGSVLRKVKNERYKDLYDQYVDGVRNDYPVKIDDAKLGELDIQPARRLSLGPGSPSRPDADEDDEEVESDEE